jgi:hypothetical protein
MQKILQKIKNQAKGLTEEKEPKISTIEIENITSALKN